MKVAVQLKCRGQMKMRTVCMRVRVCRCAYRETERERQRQRERERERERESVCACACVETGVRAYMPFAENLTSSIYIYNAWLPAKISKRVHRIQQRSDYNAR